MRIFSIDSPFMRKLSDISDLIVLNSVMFVVLPADNNDRRIDFCYVLRLLFDMYRGKGGSVRQEFFPLISSEF